MNKPIRTIVYFFNIKEINILIYKALKIICIKLAFIIPTLKAKLILTFLGCSYGKNLKVCGKVYFRPNAKESINIGDNVSLIARFLTNGVGISNPIMIECIKGGEIIIGDNSGLSSAILSSRNKICIGKNVKIGGNVRIFDHDFHSLNYLCRRTYKLDNINIKSRPVIIEDDVFIGTNSIILKGVHIGEKSIIAAGSVVIKNIGKEELWGGNPAVFIRNI